VVRRDGTEHFTWTYDLGGLLTQEVRASTGTQGTAFSYTLTATNDAVRQLTDETASTTTGDTRADHWAYDGMGNRGDTAVTHNRATQDGFCDDAYDTNGNLVSKTSRANPLEQWQYGYNHQNHLNEATRTLNGVVH
jgi:YD repeat-containing protein